MAAIFRTVLLLFVGFISISVRAYEANVEFSAEAVQSMPDRPPMIAKMFVSKNAVRTESTMNGITMVEIVYPNENRRVFLNKIRKTYFEQSTPVKQPKNKQSSTGSPCNQRNNSVCKKLATEKINGRSVIKWEMTTNVNGRSLKSLHWLDKKYQMPLREQFSDGTISTMTLLGKDEIYGRVAEKWELLATRPDGGFIKSQQWYDPNLKIVIREVLRGDYVRELRNIKIARQSKQLFKIPDDFKKETITNMNIQRNNR